MHAAVETLQMAARQMQLSGELERSTYSRIMTQLREVTDELTAVERRMEKREAGPVNFTEILRAAVATAPPPPDQDASGLVTQVPEGIMVEGPAHNLRDLLNSLVEYARTVGRDPIELRVHIKHGAGEVRTTCSTELIIQSPDVPDFLRRKLWDAARIRRGEVSVICEPECCRVEFTLPIERRQESAVG
jgi:hypothetical protein